MCSLTLLISRLDLDNCRNAATGQLSNLAHQMLATFHTYAEVSPSGLGLHIIGSCRGPKPPNFKNAKAGVELIATTFITLTGHVVNTSLITDCTDALAALMQRYHQRASIIGDDLIQDRGRGTENIGHADLPRPTTDITDADLLALARRGEERSEVSRVV